MNLTPFLTTNDRAVALYKHEIESAWSGRFGNLNVTFNVTTPSAGAARDKYNVLEIGPLKSSQSEGRPFTSTLGGDYVKLGPLDSNAP